MHSERLRHRFIPDMKEGFVCSKCGEICITIGELDYVSSTPCVDDDDPRVAEVIGAIDAKIVEHWAAYRERVTKRGGMSMPFPNVVRLKDEDTIVDSTLTVPKLFSEEEKQEFNDWLNSLDPVKGIDWEVK